MTGAPWDQTWHNADCICILWLSLKVPVSLGYYFVNRSPNKIFRIIT